MEQIHYSLRSHKASIGQKAKYRNKFLKALVHIKIFLSKFLQKQSGGKLENSKLNL